MLDWRVLAFSVPIFFVTYQYLAKLLPKGVSVFLINAYALFIGAMIMLILHLITRPDKSIHLSHKSLLLALGIGLFIGLGNLGIIKAYSLGAPQSLFTAYFYITLVVYGILVGVLVWHERLNIAQVLGVLLAVIGLGIVFYFKK